jgi:hypothetical protein
MSFSGPMQPIAASTMGATQSSFDLLLSTISTNPYFIGLMMILLNLGGRFLGLEMSPQQEKFFQHPYVRRLLIFTVLFVATRNIWVAFWMSIIVILCIGYLFNEKSGLCLFAWRGVSGSKCDTDADKKEGFTSGGTLMQLSASSTGTGLTALEEEIYQKLAQKRGAPKEEKFTAKDAAAIDKEISEIVPTDILKTYMDNMTKLTKM